MTKNKPYRQILDTQKRYCQRAMLLAFLVALCLILSGYKPAGKGLVLGTLFSTVNFLLMGYAIPRTIGKNRSQILRVNMGSLAGRMCVLAIPVYIALNSAGFNLGTTAAGLFMIQIVIIADNIVFPKPSLWLKNRISGEL